MIGLQETTMWVYVVDAAMVLVNCLLRGSDHGPSVTQRTEPASLKTLVGRISVCVQ